MGIRTYVKKKLIINTNFPPILSPLRTNNLNVGMVNIAFIPIDKNVILYLIF